MTDSPAFVICNDLGEVFQGWASACSTSPSGCEDYYSVPRFGKQVTHVAKPGQLIPMGVQYGETYRLGDPYVFASQRTAEKAMARMYGFSKLVIVELV